MRRSEEVYKKAMTLLDYNPESGIFTWRWIEPITPYIKSRNTRIAGKQAGCISSSTNYVLLQIKFEDRWVLLAAHRLAFYITYGFLPREVDHINHMRNDNRICNLRGVTHLENCKNTGKSKNNKSGVTGVYFDNTRKCWATEIMVLGKKKFLGYFKDFDGAVEARISAQEKYNFHENHGKEIEAYA